LERLSRGRAQRIAANKEKTLENGSKMPPRRLQNRSQIASKWLPEASRAPPKSGIDNWILFCSFCSPLGRLLGRSWVALGRSWRCLGASWVAPGRSRGAPGSHFRLPGASFGSSLGLYFLRLWKNTKTLKTIVFSMVFDGFGPPRGVQNRALMAPKSLLGASWHLLVLIWRLLALSWRLWAVSWRLLRPLGRLLGRS
jgi:hypothetical protein